MILVSKIEKDMSTQVKEAYWFLRRISKNKSTHQHNNATEIIHTKTKTKYTKTHGNMQSYQREIKAHLPTHECQLN